jgi:LacI family transcriptional regulator
VPGNNPPSVPKLSDVARLAGVGNTTVSRVLNGGINVSPEKLRRIQSAIEQLGYRPNRIARSLKGAASGMIGMIVPSLSDTFFSGCAEAVQMVAREHGSLLVVTASHDDADLELESLQQLLLHRIDGLVLSSARARNPRLDQELAGLTIPVVGLDRPLQNANLPSVMSQNAQGAKQATEHLLQHGYARVLCLHLKPELAPISERLRGYSKAMRDAGREPLLELVNSPADVAACLVRQLSTGRHPLAVFTANNLTARYTWEAVRNLQLAIPRHVAMLSFDDFDFADSLTPPMSVIQQPVDGLGRSAAELLFESMRLPGAIGEQGQRGSVRLPTRLIVRESCGCGPANHQAINSTY